MNRVIRSEDRDRVDGDSRHAMNAWWRGNEQEGVATKFRADLQPLPHDRPRDIRECALVGSSGGSTRTNGPRQSRAVDLPTCRAATPKPPQPSAVQAKTGVSRSIGWQAVSWKRNGCCTRHQRTGPTIKARAANLAGAATFHSNVDLGRARLLSPREQRQRREGEILPQQPRGLLRVGGDRRRRVEDLGEAVIGVVRGPARVAVRGE